MYRMLAVLLAACIAVSSAQQGCRLTDPDILGPYYIPGAPDGKDQLCAALPAHDRLVLTGQVLDYDSQCARPIPFAKLDLWQANANGVYSTGKGQQDWFCRSVVYADATGRFRFTTLMPGRYDDGGYRPAHIHFNITASGYPKLVTQLYFNLDYYLSPRDSCSRCGSGAQSLKVATVHRDDIKTFEGNWNIVLSKTPRTSFPPLSRSTIKRGSYIEIKDHIMH